MIAFNEQDTSIFDVNQSLPLKNATVLPRPADKIAFQASSWSPDGKMLVGSGVLLSDMTSAPSANAVLVYSFESKQFETLGNIIPDMMKRYSVFKSGSSCHRSQQKRKTPMKAAI